MTPTPTENGGDELTLTKTYDSDLVDDVSVSVTGDQPPADLADAVHDALTRTILHLLDGREVHWTKVEGRRGPDWKFAIHGGMPEMPKGMGDWLPPYRTREKFEGADASGDGLMGNLPDGWAHEVERGDSVFGFYQVD
jgi:hypothetical protein